MPLATAKAVITQVPCEVETPRLPEMVGSETLAMVESSTCMKVPIASIKAVMANCPPCIGASCGGAAAGAGRAGAAGVWDSLSVIALPGRDAVLDALLGAVLAQD